MTGFTEDDVERAALAWLDGLGYEVVHGPEASPDGASPERIGYDEVILVKRFCLALQRLNPDLPAAIHEEVRKRVLHVEMPSLVEENRRLHRYILNGVPVEFVGENGEVQSDVARLIDFDDVDANDWLVVNQYTVIERGNNRRPDIVVFVNGLPVAVIELKNPGDENATLQGAFNQLQTYRNEIGSLFRTNGILVVSDGLEARAGSLTADFERFMPWRTVDGSSIAAQDVPELKTMIRGVFEKRRFVALLREFTVFADAGGGLVKIVAGYHQFHAVGQAVVSTLRAAGLRSREARKQLGEYRLQDVPARERGDKRIGVIWHTQGSGKSLLMVFYAGQVIAHPEMKNPTIVIVTDRNDLDDQLFGTFAACRDLIRQRPRQAGSREELRSMLTRISGGVVFTTIQKFAPEAGETGHPVLTDRHNVVVVVDEAHRSHYGFGARVDRATGVVSHGFAKYLRDALPNASFIGFTGTPIEGQDANTPAVFGDYIDVYDISRGVEDGATVPIYYENRLARVDLDEAEKPKIDEDIAELMEGETEWDQERLKRKWAQLEAVVGAEKRLTVVARDLVDHFENRVVGMDGKAMIVCMTRRICVALHDKIIQLRPSWHSDDDNKGKLKVVMTGAASDPPGWQRHIGGTARRERLARRIKDPADELAVVIVCDMWLTGFDVPCLHTMYIDKPMRGHGLMQAIARVNRVFRDKPGGLVVDYIGIAGNLKSALAWYSRPDQKQAGIDEANAVAVMLEKYEIVRDMFHGFDYRTGLTGSPQERLVALAGAIEWVLALQQRDAAKASTDENQKRVRRRFSDAVLALSRAFALAAASDEAQQIRDEVGFFQAVRAALAKSSAGGGAVVERELAVQQIIDRAVVSTEIVDILQAAGVATPDISVLSDDFLAEIQDMKQKNLAAEALRKLINDELRSRRSVNVVETRAFSKRLERVIVRYHSSGITAQAAVRELIELAKAIRTARSRGEDEGLSEDEIAFYDALAENESAVEVLGNEQLKVIARELLNGLRENRSVDWQHRETVRAAMRAQVRRILRQYGYPPDLQKAAVQTVLQQAETLSARWAA